ncbi:hypothetical protein CIW83_14090 [Tissierella sp. P1]|nr:hypothetical protein CIW83_14090 [Tissierella sp. P1]
MSIVIILTIIYTIRERGDKMKRISTRIVITVLSCAIAMSMLVGVTSIFRSTSVIEKEMKSALDYQTQLYMKDYNLNLAFYETTATAIYQNIDTTIDINRLYEEGYLSNYSDTFLGPIVARMTKDAKESLGIFIAFDSKYTGRTEGIWAHFDEKGNVKKALPTGFTSKDENNPKFSWYFDCIKLGKGLWSDMYISNANLNVITYSMPIIINNTPIGAIGIDLSVEELVNTVKNIKLYDTGYAFLLNKDYDYLIHPTLDSSSNLKNMNDGEYSYIADEIESKGAGVTDVEFGGEGKVMAFSKLYDDKIIIMTVPKDEILKEMYNTIYIILGVVLIAAVLTTFISFVLGKKISNPIVFSAEILNTTSKLDLTHIEETKEIRDLLNRKDEVGSIFRATGALREEMRKAIKAIEDTTINIVENTASLTTATHETTQSINDMAKTVEELAQASMGQAEDAETGSEKLYRLANEIKAAVENGETLVESSAKAQRISEEGSKSMENMVEKFNITNKSTLMVAENINSLSEKSQSIGSILNTIISISEQTNLLALNAAIEAARAGEAGRGFAVVAEEIRKLSEQTGHATKSIEDILNAIQSEVETTKVSMDESEESLNDANNTLEQVKKSFDEIYKAILISMEAIKQLDERLEVVDNEKEDVILAIQSISSVTEETAASTEELSASMEEQAATMETVANNTNNLSNTIQKLNELVNRFKL